MRVRPLAALLALVAAAAAAQVAVPPVARVTDLTGTLSAEQRGGLEQRLAAFEQQKGSQVAVLIVPTTEPETIEQYAIRVAETWKLGRKGIDDGVLLLVAKDDRKLRIEVGYGLEGAIPDAIAKRIIEETITPYFKNGDFHGGIAAGLEQILKVIRGEALPEPPRQRHGSFDPGSLFFIGFVVLALSSPLGHAIGEFKSSLLAGGGFGLIAWFILGVAAWAAIAAVILFLLALIHQATRGSGGGNGWSSSGGSSGGGGFSGGGFSGGGGSFGGGGASGSW